jgi:hypothetical protein
MNPNGLNLLSSLTLALLLISPAYLTSQELQNPNTNAAADFIFHNGDIITMEESPSQVEAVAIREGTILAVGEESEILAMAGSNTRFIDLDGGSLLPQKK